jgi:hypothetical protein
MILRKFISYFLSFISFSMNFRNLNEFLEILIEKGFQKLKIDEQRMAEIGPRPGSTNLAQRPN